MTQTNDDQDIIDIVGVLDAHQAGFEILLDLARVQQDQIDHLTYAMDAVYDVLNEEQFCEPDQCLRSQYEDEDDWDEEDPDTEYIPLTRANIAIMSPAQKDAILNDLAICLDHKRLVDFVTGWEADEDGAFPPSGSHFCAPHGPFWASLGRPWEYDNYMAERDEQY